MLPKYAFSACRSADFHVNVIHHVTTDYLLSINHDKMLDVSDLSDDDMKFLILTIETLRKKNGTKK